GRGLAGAEIAGQREDGAGADQERKIRHQMRGGGLVDKREGEDSWRRHSAAWRWAARSSGNSQMTVVPLATVGSKRTSPPCSSTNDRTSDRPSPAPRCREPLE